MNYKIVINENILDDFIEMLPDANEDEVFYLALFGRHKYCPNWKNAKDHNQLVRTVAKRDKIKEKIFRMECPIGSYTRDGIVAPQECLAIYIGLNPRSLRRSNRNLLVELAKRVADGQTLFNPITLANTEVHKAVGEKHFLDFDFDGVEPSDYIHLISRIIPFHSYQIIITRGGFHLIVKLSQTKGLANKNWYKQLSELPKCDVKGTSNLTPVPGCYQGGFTPYFYEENQCL